MAAANRSECWSEESVFSLENIGKVISDEGYNQDETELSVTPLFEFKLKPPPCNLRIVPKTLGTQEIYLVYNPSSRIVCSMNNNSTFHTGRQTMGLAQYQTLNKVNYIVVGTVILEVK